MNFIDRNDAGKKLAHALRRYREEDVVVFALPRGGVMLGYEVARALNAPLSLIITRKIGHPSNSEFAICAITEEGAMLCDESAVSDIDPLWLRDAVTRERAEARRRRELYLKGQAPVSARGKIAIVVDDGVATGLTVRAAMRSLGKEHPKKIVVAVPVAPLQVIKLLKEEADEVVTLDDGREYLGVVGAYYVDFPQVSDQEVIDLLKKSSQHALDAHG